MNTSLFVRANRPRRTLRVCAAGLFVAAAGAALGQDLEGEEVQMEAFVTTGTRLGTAATQSDIPVTVISRGQLERTPYVEVADLLRSQPAFTGAGNTNDSTTNGGDGARYVDLRGLGNQYTLVLLNGRKLAYSSIQNFVDVNQIPVAAIDRVEVLTSGASAVYGTNAIGGVINVFTRKGETGGEITAFYGDDWDGDSDLGRRQFSFSFGGSEGRLDFLVAGQYFKQGGTYSDDFDWSRKPGPTGNNFPYRLVLPNSLFTPGATGTGSYVVKWKPGEGGPRDATSRADFREYDGRLPDVENPDNGGDMFPFHLYTPLLRPEERWNVSTFATYHIIPDKLRVFADFMYHHAFSYNQLAPGAQPASGVILVPATNYWNQQLFGADAVDITSGGWRLNGLGPRIDSQERDTFWINAGIGGTVAEWDWEFAATFTEEKRMDLQGNGGDPAVLNALLARTTSDAFNPFTSDLETNAEYWDQIRVDSWIHNRSRLSNLEFNVDGELFELPAGPIRSAFSANFEKSEASAVPDAQAARGSLGYNVTSATRGERDLWGASAEVEIPIVDHLTGRIAARHDDYSDFGGVDVFQGALRYQPNRQLLLRAGYGQGFVAPSILQLYEGPQEDNPTFFEPTARNPDGTWGANSQVNLIRVGNPNLGPEDAEMWNAGVVYSPDAIRGLSITVDYWETEQTDVISTAADYARVVANRFWEELGSTDAERDAAARNPATLAATVAAIQQQTGATVVWGEAEGPAGLGGIFSINNVSRANLAGQNAKGIDFAITYQRATARAGTFNFDLRATRQLLFERQALQGDPWDDLTGLYSSTFDGAWPEWRAYFEMSWRLGNLVVTPAVSYIDGVELQDGEDPVYERDHLASYATVNLQVAYQLPWETNLAIGVENLGDRVPPQTAFAANNDVPGGLYDVRGRFFYARLSKTF